MFNIGDRVKEITECDPTQTGTVVSVSDDGNKIGVEWDTLLQHLHDGGVRRSVMWPAADFCHEHETSVVLATGDSDWQGLYIDGQLVTEGHAISTMAALSEVAGKGDIVFRNIIYDAEWMDKQGYLPHILAKVQEET